MRQKSNSKLHVHEKKMVCKLTVRPVVLLVLRGSSRHNPNQWTQARGSRVLGWTTLGQEGE